MLSEIARGRKRFEIGVFTNWPAQVTAVGATCLANRK
jgi:hypothetical protein